jgi:hypothetical protein
LPGLRHALLLCLVSGAAHAAEVGGAARLWLGGGLDTNAHRDYVVQGGEGNRRLAAFGQGLLQLDGDLRTERLSLLASYDIGGRLFALDSSGLCTSATACKDDPNENVLVQNARFDAELMLIPEISLGASLRLRDRHGVEPSVKHYASGAAVLDENGNPISVDDPRRDHTDLGADFFVRFFVQQSLDVRASIGAHRFLYWPRMQHSYWGPDVNVTARFRLNRRHSVVAFLEYEPRTFGPWARFDNGDPPQAIGRRFDNFYNVGAGYQYRGPWAFGIAYSFTESDSNSFAQSYRIHTLSLNAGTKLFWDITLLGSAALRFAQLPEGLFLEDDTQQSGPIVATYDDENMSQVTLKLARPLGDRFEVDFKWQLFFNWLAPANNPAPKADEYLWYLRQTFTLGFSVRLDSR